MANEQINQYLVEATSFLNGSFMDIDQLISPGVWESQKVPFSAMINQFGNIYNYDGTITEERTLDGDLKTKGLNFLQLQFFRVRAVSLEYEADNDIKLITGAAGALILPSDADPQTNVVTPENFMVKGNSTSNDLVAYLNGTWKSLTGDGIYDGSGSLISDTTVTHGTFDLVHDLGSGKFTLKSTSATNLTIDNIANGNQFTLAAEDTVGHPHSLYFKFGSSYNEIGTTNGGFQFNMASNTFFRFNSPIVDNVLMYMNGGLTGFNMGDGGGNPIHRFYTTGVKAGATVFNELGASTGDLRAESANNLYMLFLDASADSIGIGKVAPDTNAVMDMGGVLKHAHYTVATLPTVVAGGTIYVTDEVGGATLAYGNGTNWLRVYDAAIVS